MSNPDGAEPSLSPATIAEIEAGGVADIAPGVQLAIEIDDEGDILGGSVSFDSTEFIGLRTKVDGRGTRVFLHQTGPNAEQKRLKFNETLRITDVRLSR